MSPINDYTMVFGVALTQKQTIAILCQYFPEKAAEMNACRAELLDQIEQEILDRGYIGDREKKYRLENMKEIETLALCEGPFEGYLSNGKDLPNSLHLLGMRHDQSEFFDDCYAVLGMLVGTKQTNQWSTLPAYTLMHPSRYAVVMSSLGPNDQAALKLTLHFEGSDEYYEKSLFSNKPVPSYADFDGLIQKIKQDDPCDLLDEIFPAGVEPRVVCITDDCRCCT